MTPSRAPNDYPRPPLIARLAVALTTPKGEREFVLGDLHEGYLERLEAAPFAARRWLWRESLSLVAAHWPRSTPGAKRRLHHSRPREQPMSSLWNEFRVALRSLRRAPLYSTLAVLTAATGIAASTAIFSVARPIVFESAPYASPDRLVLVWEREKDGSTSNMGFPTFADLARDVESFASAAAMSYWQPTLSSETAAEQVAGQRVSASYFATLGVHPFIGRDFRPEEDTYETRRVIMLTHGVWQRRFGSDSSIPGRTIEVSGYPYLVAGVLPPSFEDLLTPNVEVYAPLGYEDTQPWACRTCRHLRMVARVKEGASVPAAARQAERVMATARENFPTQYASAGATLEPVNVFATKGVRSAVLALLGAAALLLLMSCANVSSLMLGRAIERRTDVAVRTALGAGTGRLVRQFAVEALLVWIVAAGLGVVLATWGVRALVLLSAVPLPRVERMGVDATTFAVALGLALVSAVLAGALPGLLSSRGAISDKVRVGARNIVGRGTQRLRGALIVTEVALALVMLTGAGLLTRTISGLLAVDLGFESEGLVSLGVSVAGPRYDNDTSVIEYYRRVIDAARAVPGIQSVAITSQVPLGGNFDAYGIHRRDKPSANPENDPSAQRFGVSTDYFATMKIPLLTGRVFNAFDNASSAGVVVINRAMAHGMFPGESPIGKELQLGGTSGPWNTIVGVVGDVKHLSIDGDAEYQIYHPFDQGLVGSLNVVARVGGEPSALNRPVQAAIRALDPSLAVTEPVAMEETVATVMAQRRFVLRLLTVFAAIALVLVTAGLYGVTAAGVAERQREIGLRAALGATRARIVSTVLARSVRLVGAGIVIGVVGALALNRTLATMLFGVSPGDPLTLAGVMVVLVVVASLASLIPARRAVAVDPAITLRAE